jgi:hypothetical protein
MRAYSEASLTTTTEQWRNFYQTRIIETFAVYKKIGGTYSLEEMLAGA